MSEIRARVDTIVEDPDTAGSLKAWYRQLCKRPCFHDEYLQAFNNPNTHLVDTDGQGVERITERGVVVAGIEYEVDCIIYASGFEVGTPHERRAGFDMIGRDGLRLSDKWATGMRTMHGMHVHGFPNAFQVQATQAAALISNYPHNLTEAGRTIGCILRHAAENGIERIEVTQEAEDEWCETIMSGATGMGGVLGSAECTPGYYNNEGMPADGNLARLWAGYPGGPVAFFQLFERWRTDGRFEGLAMTSG
jgi:cyclohexanone monooxygenase